MSRRRLPLACVFVFGLLTGQAFAQPAGTQIYRSYPDGRPLYGTAVQALPSPFSQGGSCVKWCIADVTPCDPDYYKVGDRRCNQNQNGIFP